MTDYTEIWAKALLNISQVLYKFSGPGNQTGLAIYTYIYNMYIRAVLMIK